MIHSRSSVAGAAPKKASSELRPTDQHADSSCAIGLPAPVASDDAVHLDSMATTKIATSPGDPGPGPTGLPCLTQAQLAGLSALRGLPHAGFPARTNPSVEAYHHGWFYPPHKVVLAELLSPETRCVVELGSWLGKSTLFIAEHAPNAVIISVDLWDNPFVKGQQGDHYMKNSLQVP